MLNIRKAAVIGAGNMGAQIAAHLANVGIPSLLMDVPPAQLTPDEQKRGLTLKDRGVRNGVTKALFERARKLSPAPLLFGREFGGWHVHEQRRDSHIGEVRGDLRAHIARADDGGFSDIEHVSVFSNQ